MKYPARYSTIPDECSWQPQTIRDALDGAAMCLIVKERDLPSALNDLKRPPDLVITDSRVIQKVSADVPAEIALTTFSILMARQKGNLAVLAEGAAVIETLRPGDRVLIAEACSHHALEDDIGRVEIPRWLRQFVSGEVEIETFAGRDDPENVRKAQEAGVPVTNCGTALSFLQGAIRRTLAPFSEALMAYERKAGPSPNPPPSG